MAEPVKRGKQPVLLSRVLFCAYEHFGDYTQLREKALRLRRDLNPCYRRESGIAKRNSNKQQEHEGTGWRSRNSKKHLILSPMCPPIKPGSPAHRHHAGGRFTRYPRSVGPSLTT